MERFCVIVSFFVCFASFSKTWLICLLSSTSSRLFSAKVRRVVRDVNDLVTCVQVSLHDNHSSLSQRLVDGGYAQWLPDADVTSALQKNGDGEASENIESVVDDVIWSAISVARFKVQGD